MARRHNNNNNTNDPHEPQEGSIEQEGEAGSSSSSGKKKSGWRFDKNKVRGPVDYNTYRKHIFMWMTVAAMAAAMIGAVAGGTLTAIHYQQGLEPNILCTASGECYEVRMYPDQQPLNLPDPGAGSPP